MSCIKNTTRGCCFSTDANGDATAESCAGCQKLEVFDWMADLPDPLAGQQIYEVQFKNTRKGFYLNDTNLPLQDGDIVAVEASPGHDIGIITLSGELVAKQMRRTGFNPQGLEFKKIYRKAKTGDIEKWQEAIGLEHQTMIKSRQIAADLGLNMKIGDVEYQGDRLKAIFYYIADERVDFRELIKVLAEQFRIRIEMKQIGARQEAGRIGGIAACGRELCCSTWINNFSSVTIGAARHQDISLNPQKLAGQCGKLKCCLNYELDVYIDARRALPRLNGPLEAMDGSYYLVKTDIFKQIMYFSPDQQSMAIQIPLGIERVKKIMAMNRRGEKVERIEDKSLAPSVPVQEEPQFTNIVGEESITRFDKSGGRNSNRRGGNNRSRSRRGGEKPAENKPNQAAGNESSKSENRGGRNQRRGAGGNAPGTNQPPAENRENRENRGNRSGDNRRRNRPPRNNRNEGEGNKS